MFSLLVVLLAQMVPPIDDAPPDVSSGDIAGLMEQWSLMNSACRKSEAVPEGEVSIICFGRDLVRMELGRRGWCLRQSGQAIEWDMCPRR
jgi:hypothetical protein